MKTQISLGTRPVWSESSLCAQWVAKDPRFLHADSEDSDQTRRMPRLIWVFAGRTVTLMVLSCRGSYLLHVILFTALRKTERNFIEMKRSEDRWPCIAHLCAEDMLKSAVIEEKQFKHSPWAGADNPLGSNYLCQQEVLITMVICCKFKKNLFNLRLYTHFFMI